MERVNKERPGESRTPTGRLKKDVLFFSFIIIPLFFIIIFQHTCVLSYKVEGGSKHKSFPISERSGSDFLLF